MKNTKKWISILCVLAMILTVVPNSSVTASAATKMTMNYKNIVMKKGAKLTLKVNGAPAKKKITWKSSKKAVAIVSSKGIVKAKKKGKTIITAKVAGKKLTCKVTVGIPVSSVTVDKPALLLAVGGTDTITAAVMPANATVKTVSYKSANQGVATVNKSGVVTAVAPGTTTIKVISKDGNKKATNVSVTVGDAPTQNVAATPTEVPDTNPVKGIQLDCTSKTLSIGETFTLKATLTPADATIQNITWTSENTAVATVDANGVVTGVGKGTTAIVATTKSGNFKAKCEITCAENYTVTSQEQLNSALSKKSADIITISGYDAIKYEIPEEDYSNVSLVINAPNATVTNKGKFKNITILDIAKNTYHECAIGNELTVQAPDSHIVIEESASAVVYIKEGETGAGDTVLENNGIVKELHIIAAKKVTVNGTGKETIPVTIDANINIATNQNMQIVAISTFNIRINSGAEHTVISVNTDSNRPKISGLGMIQITIADTGRVVTTVADNTIADGEAVDAVDVKLTGIVKDVEDVPVTGAAVYIVPYQYGYDVQNIKSDENAVKLITDEKGFYKCDSIKTGNYILCIQEEDYMDVNQNLVITSTYGNTYNNEEINLLPSSYEGKVGNAKGSIKDSLEKDKVLPDITIYARKNKNNLVDDAIATTKTNAQGEYEFKDLPAGYYTIQAVDERADVLKKYISVYFNILVRPDETAVMGATMNMPIERGQMRFILTWGDAKSGAISDADSHMIGPKAGGKGVFHTYFSQKEYYEDNTYSDYYYENSDDSERCVGLDVDDVDWEGPETTTIYKETPGIYRFYIHDYTNGGNTSCSELSESQVRVEVYSGNFLLATYHVPAQEGTLWHVCNYNSVTGELITVNKMGYENCDVEYIGMTAYEKMLSGYDNLITKLENYISLYQDCDQIQEYKDAYDQIMKVLETSTSDEEIEKAVNDADELAQELEKAGRVTVSVSSEDEVSYNQITDTNKLTVTLDKQDSEYTVSFTGVDKVTEIASTDSSADKAYELEFENGLKRVIDVYVAYNVKVTSVTVKGQEAAYFSQYDDEISVVGTVSDATVEDLEIMAGENKGQIVSEDGEYYVVFTIGASTTKKRVYYRYKAMPTITLKSDVETIASNVVNASTYYFVGNKESITAEDLDIVAPEGYTYRVSQDEDDDEYAYNLFYVTLYTEDDEDYYDSFPVKYYSQEAYEKTVGIDSVSGKIGEYNAYATIDEEKRTATFECSSVLPPTELQVNYGDYNDRYKVTYVSGEEYFAVIEAKSEYIPDYTVEYKVYFESTVEEDDIYPNKVEINGEDAIEYSTDWGEEKQSLIICGFEDMTVDNLAVSSRVGLDAVISQDAEGNLVATFTYGDIEKQYDICYKKYVKPEISPLNGCEIKGTSYSVSGDTLYMYVSGSLAKMEEAIEISVPEGYTYEETDKTEEDINFDLVDAEGNTQHCYLSYYQSEDED